MQYIEKASESIDTTITGKPFNIIPRLPKFSAKNTAVKAPRKLTVLRGSVFNRSY